MPKDMDSDLIKTLKRMIVIKRAFRGARYKQDTNEIILPINKKDSVSLSFHDNGSFYSAVGYSK